MSENRNSTVAQVRRYQGVAQYFDRKNQGVGRISLGNKWRKTATQNLDTINLKGTVSLRHVRGNLILWNGQNGTYQLGDTTCHELISLDRTEVERPGSKRIKVSS